MTNGTDSPRSIAARLDDLEVRAARIEAILEELLADGSTPDAGGE